jgi:hypothetical protein
LVNHAVEPAPAATMAPAQLLVALQFPPAVFVQEPLAPKAWKTGLMTMARITNRTDGFRHL